MSRVIVVLHAHLPWVREAEPWSPIERWFHEAMWECYLPLLGLLREQPGIALTLSLSPPLLAMMRDEVLLARCRDHLALLAEKNHELAPHAALRDHYAARIDAAGALLDSEPDLPAAFTRLPNVELCTTAASHAYLPGLTPVRGAFAQLAMGRACARLGGRSMWLPECGWCEDVDQALGRLEVGATVTDAHALRFAAPRVETPALVTPRGVVCAARHRDACMRVWSRQHGYPGHPDYREFFRDAGHDAPPARLEPFGAGSMTGLKYHRVTGREDKQLYDPGPASERATRDADDYAAFLEAEAEPDDVVLVAFDAELFGHWWHEGLTFLRALFARIACPGTLGDVGREAWPVASPAVSSWGRGGFSEDWINPRTARLWPTLHRAHQTVVSGLRRAPEAAQRRAALDHAVAELLLLEASDWIYMISNGEHESYARGRVEAHQAACLRMADIANGAAATRDEEVRLCDVHPLLAHVPLDGVRAALLEC